eukprot:11596071-Alexandrium_andersonii.AAC.1
MLVPRVAVKVRDHACHICRCCVETGCFPAKLEVQGQTLSCAHSPLHPTLCRVLIPRNDLPHATVPRLGACLGGATSKALMLDRRIC